MKKTAVFRHFGGLAGQSLLQGGAVFCLCLLACVAAFGQQSVTAISRVEMLLSDQSAVQVAQEQWTAFTLPYRMITDTPDSAYVWFRFSVPRQRDAAPLSLYLSNYMYSVDVYLNHVRIGGTSQPPDTLAIGWTHPLLVSLPLPLVQEESNTVHVRLTQAAYTNVLSTLLVGPESLLLPIWQGKLVSQSQVALVALVLCVLMGVFTLGLWVQRPHDLEFAWFSGICICMAMPMFYLSISYAVISHSALLLAAVDGIILAAGCYQGKTKAASRLLGSNFHSHAGTPRSA